MKCSLISWINLEIYLFSFSSHFYMFHLNSTRQKFSIIALANADSWFITECHLNITFIQLSTHHDCFSLAHFNLIFFCLCICSGFSLTIFYINPVSSCRFHRILSQTFAPVLTNLFFICFPVHCVIFRVFYPDAFYYDIFCDILICFSFSFFITPLYLHRISVIANWEQLTSFTTFFCGLPSWMRFTIISIVSIDISFVGVMFPSN